MYVSLTAILTKSADFDNLSRMRMCVLPNDLDLNLHMNNSRYYGLLDLGKVDLMIRSGLATVAWKKKWRPIIGGTLIRYRFGLKPFERLEIVTCVSCWDDKWFYFDQRVKSPRGTAAIALTKVLLRDRNRSITPVEVLGNLGRHVTSPPIPLEVAQWISTDEMLRADERT